MRIIAALFLLVVGPFAATPLVTAQLSRDASVGTFPFLVGNMDNQIQTLVDTTFNNGLDTIYVSAFRATGQRQGTLWVTDRAGTWNATWGPVRPGGAGIDLQALIAAAHQKGLQVVAVLKCFDTTVTPTDLSHRQYLLDVIDYLVKSYDASGNPVYDLDGIALDYVRFVGSNGNSPAPVTAFVADVKRAIAPLTLHAYVLAGRYTFDGPTYDLNFNSYNSVISSNASQYGQHWEQLARYVDVMMPMAYTANGSIYNTYAAHQGYVQTVARYARLACQRAGFGGRRVVITVRCWTDTSETATTQTVDASVSGALAGGADGYQSFRYGTTQSGWWAALRAHAVPGPNRPIPSFTASASGMSVQIDATGSRDFDEPTSTLRVRFDWEGDGQFDTALSTQQRPRWGAPSTGTWRVAMEVVDSTGLTGYTTRRVRLFDTFLISPASVSAALGGTMLLRVSGGPSVAGFDHVIAASVSGTTPGTTIAPGFVVPLNFDAVTWASIALGNSPLLRNSIGTLNFIGQVAATFNPGPGLLSSVVGMPMHFAAVATSGSATFVTNPVTLTIVP